MMRLCYSYTLWVVLTFLVGQLAMAEVVEGAEEITYLLEDFSAKTPNVWRPRGEVSASAAAETAVVHDGDRAVRLTFDMSKCPDGNNAFAHFGLGHQMIGHPQSVSIWVYNEGNDQPIPLKLWLVDAGGEQYVVGQQITHVGWERVTFDFLHSGPAWPSGDKNGRQDAPMTVHGLAVDYRADLQGTLVIDSMEASTIAEPREALLPTVTTEAVNHIFWDEEPVLELAVKNYGSTAVGGLRFDVTIHDDYYKKDVQEKSVEVGAAAGEGTLKATLAADVPFGFYVVDWVLRDEEGAIRGGSLKLMHTMAACGLDTTAVEERYMSRTNPWGGVFWQCRPERARETGARWIRNWVPWRALEPEAGRYDMSGALERVKKFTDYGISSLWFATLYEKPGFYDTEQVGYAPAYGRFHRELAGALAGQVDWYELGNEDNGPTKYIYTEIARHGAAGVRAAQPEAIIANSGTAFVDINWLRMQARRGLMERLDALSVHPYTTTASPEAWGVKAQAELTTRLIDEYGGMKFSWTTEFGWPEAGLSNDGRVISAIQRANYVPRHFLVGVAGGYEKQGLYAWDGHFGIYDNGRPRIAAASTHAMARFTEGYRFAGMLAERDDVWTMVWERFGEPVLIAWSPSDDGRLVIDARPETQAYDLFGNVIDYPMEQGRITLELREGPQYVIGLDAGLTMRAWENEVKALQRRLRDCLGTIATFKDTAEGGVVRTLAEGEVTVSGALAGLQQVDEMAGELGRHAVSALRANILRLMLMQCRMGTMAEDKWWDDGDYDTFADEATIVMERYAEQDLELAGMPWLMGLYETYGLERDYALSCEESEYAERLGDAQGLLAWFAERYLLKAENGVLNAIWPYLYTVDDDGGLVERLEFVPGIATTVRVRLNNYAVNDYTGRLSLELPEGWQAEPAAHDIALKAGRHGEASFAITAATGDVVRPAIKAVYAIEGKPKAVTVMNDIRIIPMIEVTPEPMSGVLPDLPLTLKLHNNDDMTHSGVITLLTLEGEELARVTYHDLAARGDAMVAIDLSETVGGGKLEVPAGNEWQFQVSATASGELVTMSRFKVDFVAAGRAVTSLTIDGDLSDWNEALPLHVDREEYTKGTFGGSWSMDDLSGTCYCMWDDTYLYFAAVVTDQLFNQDNSEGAMWSQDSIQLSFALDVDSARTELGLASTPKGDQVYRFSRPVGLVSSAKLATEIGQTETIYECAIPWSELPGITPESAVFRYAVLFNDDDVLVPRRYMERFGGIGHNKNVAEHGTMTLLR